MRSLRWLAPAVRVDETGGRLAFFFSSRRRHTRLQGDWSSDVCSSDLAIKHPKTWDVTKNRIFTLSDDTEKTVKGLKTEIEILAFYTPVDPQTAQHDQI